MNNSIKDTIKRNSDQLRDIVKKMVEARNNASANNLPVLPVELEPLAKCLGKSDFTLVVSGEVNRGKSTFINAIIGQDILPTFDKETTSQVFKIKNSNDESFYVVLEDGFKVSIQKDELKKYGTELAKEESSSAFSGKRILYLEVNVPIVNLPADVTIVDTPGIGSTFKSHTEIAKGFMQEADAVIYLCSSKHPIVKVDVDFIKSTVLPIKTSPNVLFIMAKADLADSEEALADMVARAESQLKENFKDYPAIGKQVIPIDSLSLKESNSNTNQEMSTALRAVSNFDEVNNAIQHLIERQRFCWLVVTFNCAAKYYKRVNQFLEKQVADYDISEEFRQERLTSIDNRLVRFESELGVNRQREVLEKISNILACLRADLKNEFSSDKSTLLKKYNKRIDEIPKNISSESLNAETQEIFSDLVDDATTTWETLCEETVSEIQNALNIYHNECQVEIDEEYNLQASNDEDFSVDLGVTMSERVDAMRGKYFTAVFGTTIGMFAIGALSTVSSTVASLASSIAFGPAGLVVAGAAIVYGLFYGNKKAKEKAFNKATSEIKSHIKDILYDIYNQLTAVSLLGGKHESMLKSFEKSIQEGATDTISSIYNKTLQELQAARTEIQKSSNSQNRIKIINQQTLFNNFAIELQKLTVDIKYLNVEFENI